MALKPRTGNQYVISSGEWSAVVTELGASLRELKWRGEDLIVPFDPNKVIPCCNGWVLAPYPNRVTNGQYSFDGEDYQMPIDEFDRQSSLHGYAYRYMWELVDLQESHVTLSWRSPDIAGYPFDITITATYALDENGLTETFPVYHKYFFRLIFECCRPFCQLFHICVAADTRQVLDSCRNLDCLTKEPYLFCTI